MTWQCAATAAAARTPPALAALMREVAGDVERALLRTVVSAYAQRGFVYEHFSSLDGHPRGTHPFTGWSALVALMPAGRYPL
jgi:mannosyl-oligosaccharide glucosidase